MGAWPELLEDMRALSEKNKRKIAWRFNLAKFSDDCLAGRSERELAYLAYWVRHWTLEEGRPDPAARSNTRGDDEPDRD
jgi:hypothetical protein